MKNYSHFIKNNILKENIILLSNRINNTFLLYNKKTKKQVGYIGFNYCDSVDTYTVGGIFLDIPYMNNGLGTFLYESAMTHVYPKGLSMSRDGSTSPAAISIWNRFNDRKDVKKERMYSDEITHKKKDLPAGGMYDDNLDELEHIFILEDTKFYYTYGKKILNNYIKEGNIYKKEHNITDNDIEIMTWDLE